MIEQFEMVAKAAADSSRVRILKLLQGGELCVCQLTSVIGLATATVSRHLALLRIAGLVQSRKDGRWVYYRLAEGAINPYAPDVLRTIGDSLDDDPTVMADRLRLAQINEIPLQAQCSDDRAVGAVADLPVRRAGGRGTR